jgi:hypothetical protein
MEIKHVFHDQYTSSGCLKGFEKIKPKEYYPYIFEIDVQLSTTIANKPENNQCIFTIINK